MASQQVANFRRKQLSAGQRRRGFSRRREARDDCRSAVTNETSSASQLTPELDRTGLSATHSLESVNSNDVYTGRAVWCMARQQRAQSSASVVRAVNYTVDAGALSSKPREQRSPRLIVCPPGLASQTARVEH